MKKFLGFFSLVVLCGCSCQIAVSQIPPQYILVNENCQAVLPDYTTDQFFVITDNCGVKSKTQTPAPGYILNAVNQTVTVVVRATDFFDNYAEVSFLVTAKDNQPPTITPTGDLLAANWEVINSMYDAADMMLAEQEAYFDENFDWEAAGIPVAVRATDQYDKKVLSILTSPGHAKTGYGGRTFLFLSNNDSYIVK